MGLVLAYNKGNAQPNFTVGAAITGTAEVGQTLTCTYTVLRARSQNVTVRWYLHTADDGTDPTGEQVGVGTTYMVRGDDQLGYLRAIAFANNPAGDAQSTSAYTAQVPSVEQVIAPTAITLSSNTIVDSAEVGAVIGTLSSNGDAPVTFSEIADPDSKFTVSGNQLLLGAVVDYDLATSHSVTVRAQNSGGSKDETFTIQVGDADGSFVVLPALSLDAAALGWNAGEYVQVDFEVSAGPPTVQWFYFTNPADIDGTKTNLSAGAVAPAALLPVSAPNAYRAAYFMDMTTFGGANAGTRYIGCDVTIGATTERTTYTTAAIGDILGTPINAATFGSGAYWLPAASTQYYLTEDLTCDHSGFMACKVAQTLNLNGYTLTYANTPVLYVTNHSFETGSGTTADGWDFSNAGSTGAQIHAPADAAAAYALSQLTDGAQSLKFTNTTTSGYVQSTSTVTLESSRAYVLSAQCTYGGYGVTNPGVVMYAELRNAADDSLVARVQYSGNQGSNMYQIVTGFTAPSGGCSAYVRLGITGHASATQTVYFDNVTVEQTSMCAVYTGYWTSSIIPDFAATQGGLTASGNEFCIKNGNIVQGQPHYKANAVVNYNQYAHYSASGSRPFMSRVNVTVSGNSAHCVRQIESNSDRRQTIQHCTFTSNALLVSNRQAFDGTCVWGLRGPVIRYNTFLNGPHAGIKADPTTLGTNYPIGATIYGNRFYMKDRATNAFAIQPGRAAVVYDNQIFNGSGDYHGRGIAATSGYSVDKRTQIYNNLINVQAKKTIQEYGGGFSLGAYGIQCESTSEYGDMEFMHVHDNVVNAYGNADFPSQALRVTVRIQSPFNETVNDVTIENNQFNAYSGGSGWRSNSMSIYAANNITFSGNTLRTNDGLVFISEPNTDLLLDGTHIVADSLVASPAPWQTDGAAVASEIEFTNTTFEDAASESLYNTPASNFTVTRTS